MKRKYDEFQYEVELSRFDHQDLYAAWIKEKPALKRREISTLFQWDAKDGKISDSFDGFNDYLLELFKSELASGWSIAEEVNPFKLLPLQVQSWYDNLYFYNRTLLLDAWSADERYPDLDYADFIRELYDDKVKKEDWETAIPQCFEPETQYAADFLLWVLEDDGGFETRSDYKAHCEQWKELDVDSLRLRLTALMKENDLFQSEFIVSYAPDYEKDEQTFFEEIDFEHIHCFLRDDYNKWP